MADGFGSDFPQQAISSVCVPNIGLKSLNDFNRESVLFSDTLYVFDGNSDYVESGMQVPEIDETNASNTDLPLHSASPVLDSGVPVVPPPSSSVADDIHSIRIYIEFFVYLVLPVIIVMCFGKWFYNTFVSSVI